jgi:hypothetical protein
MPNYLYEIVPFQAKIVEAKNANGRMVVEGLFQTSDKKNANGRIYPKSIWEKTLRADETNKAINERRMFGELDHPQDGKWELKRASHIVTALSMTENGEILGRAEVLDTPNGKILQELFSAGATVGISSRGSGSVKKTNDGEIVQEDYKLETYDFVANPSTPGAYPKMVTEDVEDNSESIKENYMESREKLALLETKAASVISLIPSEVTEKLRPVVDNIATDLVVNLTKLGNEAPDLKSLTESLVGELNDKRKAFRAPPVEEKCAPDKKEEKDDDEKDEAITVKEETEGTADTGFHRSVPKEEKPASGEGWPVNPGDAGVLQGINDGVDEFMSKSRPVVEEKESEKESGDDDEEEEEEESEKVVVKGSHDKVTVKQSEKESEKESVEDSLSGRLTEIAINLVSEPATKQNFVARAFAAAFLMESNKRVVESQAYSRVVEKLQEKFQEAAKTGKITLSEEGNEELKKQYETALKTIEELQIRHRLLSAKVYAEQELRKLGLHENAEARKKLAEAIRKAATKTSIDEAVAELAKTVKQDEREIKEAVQPPTKTLEGAVSKLNEETKPETKLAFLEGAALGAELSSRLSFSRSKVN